MRFASFLCVQIYFWNANVSWTSQSISSGRRAAWYWIVPLGRSFFIYYATCWSGGGKEENCEWGKRGEVREIDQFSIIFCNSIWLLYTFLESMMQCWLLWSFCQIVCDVLFRCCVLLMLIAWRVLTWYYVGVLLSVGWLFSQFLQCILAHKNKVPPPNITRAIHHSRPEQEHRHHRASSRTKAIRQYCKHLSYKKKNEEPSLGQSSYKKLDKDPTNRAEH